MLRVVMAAVEGAFRRRLSDKVNLVLMVLSAFYRVSVGFRCPLLSLPPTPFFLSSWTIPFSYSLFEFKRQPYAQRPFLLFCYSIVLRSNLETAALI
jgi:hypothetical protein